MKEHVEEKEEEEECQFLLADTSFACSAIKEGRTFPALTTIPIFSTTFSQIKRIEKRGGREVKVVWNEP